MLKALARGPTPTAQRAGLGRAAAAVRKTWHPRSMHPDRPPPGLMTPTGVSPPSDSRSSASPQGPEGPWTEDPILDRYKFCNTYRAADRVSQYLIRGSSTAPTPATSPRRTSSCGSSSSACSPRSRPGRPSRSDRRRPSRRLSSRADSREHSTELAAPGRSTPPRSSSAPTTRTAIAPSIETIWSSCARMFPPGGLGARPRARGARSRTSTRR